MARTFDVIEPARNPRAFVLAVTLVPALIAIAGIYAFLRPPPPPFLGVAIVAAMLLPNVLIARWADRRSVTLEGSELRIEAAMATRTLDAGAFDLDRARVVRLDEHPEWRPFLRTGGLGMPGLSLGWFRTRGLVRIFCILTDRQRVLLLPLREGKEAVLLSLKRPEDLLSALRAAHDAAPRRR